MAQANKHRTSSPTAPLQNSTGLTDQLAELLRGYVRDGTWLRGGKLPTEAALSESLGVSRTVVREAVSRLKSEGLLKSRQGSGVFVAEEDVMRSLRFDETMIGSLRSVIHIVEIRRALEADASAIAAKRATAAQIKAIRKAYTSIDKAVRAGGDGVAEDMAFHHAIAEATGNPRFVEMFDFLEQYLRAATRTTRTNEAKRKDFSEQVVVEHEAIIDAISDRDADRARRAAATHMDNAARRINSSFK
jgi:GntR family transcriptional regulator, transcriptional repressor for pyruvate dehydrogenase complex